MTTDGPGGTVEAVSSPWRGAWVVAAAPGTIAYRSNGTFDRSCAMGGGNGNAVYVRHADGSVAWYGHVKNGSLTPKLVGATPEHLPRLAGGCPP